MSTEQAGAAQQASATQEAAGMSVDIVEKLQEKATVLTQERKRRGKTVPEELASFEQVHPHKANRFANGKIQVIVGGAFIPPLSSLCLCAGHLGG